ncbi:hypothetical protein A3D11_04140 [Candidatus Peribacteria bacterium RIFCSPHIGHO2_02_FULL_49_16]|nr:MAG: hypothetical protein A2880_00230 [Candidatus Peribacteria bacterium RIFCSPHIGHO2_01_FULL_49_38]OGJ59188.1 MAG: hypothetical protein A3D11_04140 [Candidatus Peribacteria bacterium RIFCSPHIGHO2_02_FULL_49_16]
MRHWQNIVFIFIILFIIAFGLWQSQWDIRIFEESMEMHPFLSAMAYVLFLIGSIVLLPFSSLPLLPLAARIFGVWMTGILSIIGWWIGCLIAFQIARMGRRVLEKFVSFKAVDHIEKRIPPDIGFLGIVVLRMLLPTDMTSYVLGLLKNLRFSIYATASLLGIIPFAFVWSYAGGEIGKGDFFSGAVILLILCITVIFLRKLQHKRRI